MFAFGLIFCYDRVMETMLRTHKIALDLTDKQKTHLAKCAGVSRFAYNWAVGEWNRMYEARKDDSSLEKPNQLLLRRMLNAIKREQFPWMLEVTKCAPQEAIIDLGKAFNNFFKGRANRPVFKKKGIHDSFRVSSGFFHISGKAIRLPIIGVLRMREELRFENTRPVSVTISRRAGRWYASIACEIGKPERKSPKGYAGNIIGIDAGVNAYVTSAGTEYETPHSYRKAEKKLRRAQQSLSRKKKGSRNYAKQKRKVARIHAELSDERADFLQKMTAEIVSDADVIVIEDLNVKGMLKNRRLSKSITDASFGEFRRQLTYKTEAEGKALVIADRFYPSSKMCSVCGAKAKRLTLDMREWVCEECGAVHDREINAAINLRKYAESSPVPACGEFKASAISRVGENMASCLYEAGTKQQIAS
jgi:putative transposase